MIHISRAAAQDIDYLIPRLRPEDVDELNAMGQSAAEALPISFQVSEAYAVRSHQDSEPFAVFGIAPSEADPQLGVVWFMGTSDVSQHRRDILTLAKYSWLPEWSRRFPKGLHNFVDDRNAAMLKWCQAVGFQIIQSLSVGDHTFSHIHYV